MKGRVAILSDGDPTALIVPVTLFAFYQSPDDYNNRWIVGSFVRMIRLMSFLIAFLLPAIYIATVAFHPDVLPLELVYTIKASLEKVPFPPIFEALLLELIFELLREAGIRLPSQVGQTIGIVDRTDLIFIPIWMITLVASIASYYCAASIGIGHIFNLGNHKKAVPIVEIISFSIALFIDTPEELKVLAQFTDWGFPKEKS